MKVAAVIPALVYFWDNNGWSVFSMELAGFIVPLDAAGPNDGKRDAGRGADTFYWHGVVILLRFIFVRAISIDARHQLFNQHQHQHVRPKGTISPFAQLKTLRVLVA
jgi:hypothetical protein